MVARAEIRAGVCGYITDVRASSSDDQHVTLAIETECCKIRKLAEDLAPAMPLDVYAEVAGDGALMGAVRSYLSRCCPGCAVPAGLFKAMQVAAGVALPCDVVIKLRREPAAA
ncbi:MAG: hypothetical protein HYU66_11790 [Armatimonadetes bacterium]|nr:hypothetical protein [Armatimonadota bacterium]